VLAFSGCSPKAKASRHLSRADRYFQSNQFDKAEIEYINALRNSPTNAVALRQLGIIYFEEGRLSRAFPFLSEALKHYPANPDLHLKLGRVYLSGNKLPEARKEANAILKQSMDDPDALALLAEAVGSSKDLDDTRQRLQQITAAVGERYGVQVALALLAIRTRDLRTAETLLKSAQVLDPKSSSAYFLLGGLYASQSNMTLADQALKTAADLAPIRSPIRMNYASFKAQTGDLETAGKNLDEIIAKAPDYLPARVRRAEISAAQKKYDEADALLKEALNRDPGNYEAMLLTGRLFTARGDAPKAAAAFEQMSASYPRVAQVHFYLGNAYLQNKNEAKALSSLRQAVLIQTNFTEAVLLLAELDIRRGEIGSAIGSLIQLIKQQPNFLPAHLLLATAYRNGGSPAAAVPIYTQFMEKFPANPDLPFLLGLTYRQLEKSDDAQKAFERAEKLAPDKVAILEQLIDLDLEKKRFTEAKLRCNTYAQKHPTAPEPHFLLGRVYEAQQNLTDAETSLREAIKLSPEYRPAYVFWAQMYVDAKKHTEALEKVQRALNINSNDAVALRLEGFTYDALGDHARAASDYEKLLKLKPNDIAALNDVAYIYSEYLDKVDLAVSMARKSYDLSRGYPAISDTFGWALFRQGKIDAALPLVSDAAQKLPDEPEVQYHLGVIRYQLAEENASRYALSQAVATKKTFKQRTDAEQRLSILNIKADPADQTALSRLEDRLKQNPQDVIALAKIATIYEQKGDASKAAEAYETLLKASPTALAPMLKLASLYVGPLKDLDKALNMANKAWASAPEDPGAIHALGRIFLLRGDFSRSILLLEQGTFRESGDPTFLSDLAMAYYTVGRNSEAEKAFQSALDSSENFPGRLEAKQSLALITEAGTPFDPKKAGQDAENLLKTNPGNLPALMLAAQAQAKRGDPTGAKKAYEQMLARYPAFGPALKQLAFLSAPGDDKKAFELASKAKPLLSDDPELTKFLGTLSYRLANYPAAILFLTDASQKQPEADTFYYLGMAHNKVKHVPETKQALLRAISLQGKSPLRAEADQILSTIK